MHSKIITLMSFVVAIISTYCSEKPTLFILIGPPGSGKTRALNFILNYFKLSQAEKEGLWVSNRDEALFEANTNDDITDAEDQRIDNLMITEWRYIVGKSNKLLNPKGYSKGTKLELKKRRVRFEVYRKQTKSDFKKKSDAEIITELMILERDRKQFEGTAGQFHLEKVLPAEYLKRASSGHSQKIDKDLEDRYVDLVQSQRNWKHEEILKSSSSLPKVPDWIDNPKGECGKYEATGGSQEALDLVKKFAYLNAKKKHRTVIVYPHVQSWLDLKSRHYSRAMARGDLNDIDEGTARMVPYGFTATRWKYLLDHIADYSQIPQTEFFMLNNDRIISQNRDKEYISTDPTLLEHINNYESNSNKVLKEDLMIQSREQAYKAFAENKSPGTIAPSVGQPIAVGA